MTNSKSVNMRTFYFIFKEVLPKLLFRTTREQLQILLMQLKLILNMQMPIVKEEEQKLTFRTIKVQLPSFQKR